ncbi:uncharacterized protein A1O5_03118 [Cladophialophora psammophila CBS 110553]|uniref:Uncharacterized protein n=1 Tax=Cladophialophora psammophila CBS 110553 TaxID=1182543 RepID=W9WZL9_9EURO|nr:uncharacterized protein A1O5_03118 [Cladophialophora psammophila CBS 110553]EXJ73358.1 hypothetical protein A1O5_03118 [Cladophialophora psammophila CBS 110553]
MLPSALCWLAAVLAQPSPQSLLASPHLHGQVRWSWCEGYAALSLPFEESSCPSLMSSIGTLSRRRIHLRSSSVRRMQMLQSTTPRLWPTRKSD